MGETDTIFAVATGAGRAAIAILRLSGPLASPILEAVAGDLPPPRRAVVRALHDEAGERLDAAMLLWFPGPRSYTGEDSAEFHVHGGSAVVRAVASFLVRQGARPAMPGEFTRRAFLNGRMDLLEAEAVHDLVAAETEAQRRQALRQLDGEASRQVASWRTRLETLLAWQEALIDFPDEDLPDSVESQLRSGIAELVGEMRKGADHVRDATRLREGIVFAVVGAPNVGKSSLVNALARREISIVSPIPGTTRDALEVVLELEGLPVTLVDTAGLRETTDPVEQEGVRRAKARAEAADLILRVVEAPGVPGPTQAGELCVINKIDCRPVADGMEGLGVSAQTGEGIEPLRARLAEAARRLVPASGLGLSRARHEAALRACGEHLAQAAQPVLPELRAEALRLALHALGRITAPLDNDALLDTIFGQFCIGK